MRFVSQGDISSRKADHIDLCATGDVGFQRKTTLLEEVELVHDSLPELSADEVDPSVELFGKRLRAPVVIAAMTGGTPRAIEINRTLASLAEEKGLGFGFGSQRPMLTRGSSDGFEVRDVAPTTLLLGNLGGVQAAQMAPADVIELARRVGADALCVHLNPAQELVQPGGDRDFRGVVRTLRKLVDLGLLPIVAKETGCGIGPAAARKLAKAGVRHVDVSGSGGTSWVAVEAARATGAARDLGVAFREWGVPTAAAVLSARAARPKLDVVIATGGVASGLDVARAVALGASACGLARPVLQAITEGGREGAARFLDAVILELRAAMLLTGSRSVAALRRAPRLLGPRLSAWASLARG